ncbi:MAG: hypothetical protein V3G42_07410 [Oscillospiraceae bacterium]
MKREDLFQAIGETDEDLLDEKIITVKRKNIFPALISIAACVAIVAGAVWIMPEEIPSDNAQPEIQMETIDETIINYNAPPADTAEMISRLLIDANENEKIETQIPLIAETPTELLTQSALETTPTQIHYPAMPAFVHGKYQAVNESGAMRYFWFDDNGGRWENEENGTGSGFTLEYLEIYNEDGSTDAIFHIDATDENILVKIAYGENGTLVVKWQDGTEETFTYLGE